MKKKQIKQKRIVKFIYKIANKEDYGKKARLVNTGKEIKVFEIETGKEIKLCKTILSTRERNNQSKPEKIISTFHNATENNRNIENEIFQFDYIFTIDTNTILSNNEFLSIGVLIALGPINRLNTAEIKENKQFRYQSEPRWYFVNFSKEKITNIEQLVWVCAIVLIQRDPSLQNRKLGLVVDSCLDEISDFNLHKKLIANFFSLPENFTLIYASADNNDHIYNKLIAESDKHASTLIKFFIEKKVKYIKAMNFCFTILNDKIDIKALPLGDNK